MVVCSSACTGVQNGGMGVNTIPGRDKWEKIPGTIGMVTGSRTKGKLGAGGGGLTHSRYTETGNK